MALSSSIVLSWVVSTLPDLPALASILDQSLCLVASKRNVPSRLAENASRTGSALALYKYLIKQGSKYELIGEYKQPLLTVALPDAHDVLVSIQLMSSSEQLGRGFIDRWVDLQNAVPRSISDGAGLHEILLKIGPHAVCENEYDDDQCTDATTHYANFSITIWGYGTPAQPDVCAQLYLSMPPFLEMRRRVEEMLGPARFVCGWGPVGQ